MSSYLPTLRTDTPELGFELALKLSRLAVKKTQPDEAMRNHLRTIYENDADALISSSQVVATNFRTIAVANGYWLTIAG
ncbi:hexameric tyrosine-coordinated heme protein [Sphingomonas sp. H160509]|uniref:hexameric tyrosine-coordinated heme protein n=1 Tax=Sphingomonas sp. H160509 TaxID=2955313 RepID=UPI00209859BF|nr:hexameric tyrosine-coordinated heme protein [Sphingomonas sp. H160509]MDD1453294.1 hexameric tyrosine-coordinated heme protein [Sphingomonas sp. H160509]